MQALLVGPGLVRRYRLLHGPAAPVPLDTLPLSAADSAQRAAALQLLRDSLGLDVQTRGHTITHIALMPQGEAALVRALTQQRPVLQGIGRAFAVAFTLAIVVLFAPTWLALALTLTWVGTRRAVARGGDRDHDA